MERVIEELGDVVISDVLQEAVDEATGRSKKKWAIVVLAVVVGGIWAAAIMRKRRRAAERSEGPSPIEASSARSEHIPDA